MKHKFKLVHFALLSVPLVVALAPLFAYAVNDNQAVNQKIFEVKISDGTYFYKSAPNLIQNEFLPLWIIEGGKIVDPVRRIKTKGLPSAQKNLAERNFDVFAGKTQVGSFSKVELSVNNLCGPAQFLPSTEATGYYLGNKTLSFEMQESTWGRQQRIFTSSRVFAIPQTVGFTGGAAYQPVSESEREALVGVIQTTLVPNLLKKISIQIVKQWGRNYKITGQGKSGLVFLEKVDIDNNGKPDFVGTYHLSARYGMTDDTSLPTSILFVYLNGLELKQLAFSFGPDVFVLLGVMDVSLDGIAEIIYEEKIASLIEGGDPGVRIHLLHKDAKGWVEVYRSSSVCDSKLYDFLSF